MLSYAQIMEDIKERAYRPGYEARTEFQELFNKLDDAPETLNHELHQLVIKLAERVYGVGREVGGVHLYYPGRARDDARLGLQEFGTDTGRITAAARQLSNHTSTQHLWTMIPAGPQTIEASVDWAGDYTPGAVTERR